MRVDPFDVEVVRNGLSSIAEEMSAVVMRSARSPVLREAGDLSSILSDAEGDQIAQGKDMPVHMGVMSFTVREFLKVVPKDRLREGDVWFLNLPHIGGNHLLDVKAIRPIFRNGEIRAFAVNLAHWAEVGGAAPGSYYAAAHDAWMEGLRIPPIRLFAADGVDEEKLQMILANIRGADMCRGDILAQMASTRAADLRMQVLFDTWGDDYLADVFEDLHDHAEAQMRDAIRTIPDGRYEGEDFMDDDGHGGPPTPIRVTIDVLDDEIVFDYSASGDAVPGPINITRFLAASATFYTMKSLFGRDVQASAGCYRPITTITRPGSICEAPFNKPVVGGNHETSQRLVDAGMRAFEAVVPERLRAGSTTTSGLILLCGYREDGVWTTLYETHGGGDGAWHNADGMDVVRAHLANIVNTPAEVLETEYPFDVEFQRVRKGSGGTGRQTGGNGQERAYRMRVDDIFLTTMFERAVIAPWGLQGGGEGALFQVDLHRTGATPQSLPGKYNTRIHKGDVLVVRSCGGGGYGKVSDRKTTAS